MKIGLLQLHNESNITTNIEKIILGINNLVSKGAELIILQELHNLSLIHISEPTRRS